MRKKMKAFLAAVAAVMAGLTVAAGTASASTGGAPAGFAAQARSAGLSGAQAGQLQQEVNGFVGRYGGTQAAINEVDFTGGSILFAIPGETYARDLTLTGSKGIVPDVGTCSYLYFCAFTGTGYSGTKISMYYCQFYDTFSLYGNGSWINNQTAGTRARFYDSNYRLIFTTPPAPSRSPSYNWTPVYHIKPC